MPPLSFHRKGTALGYMYITTIHAEETGWGWKGHKRAVGSRSGDPGPVVTSGDVYAEPAEAERAADAWFYSIPNIVELTPTAERGFSTPRLLVAAAPAAVAPPIEPPPASTGPIPAAPAAPPVEARVAEPRPAASGHPAAVRQEINRGLNFFGTATFAILATSIVHGLTLPDDAPHKIEDLVFGAIAAAAVGRYLWGRNRFGRSLAPLWLLALGVVTKVSGAWLRTGSPVPVGPDLGITLLLGITGLVFVWQFYATRPRGEPPA